MLSLNHVCIYDRQSVLIKDLSVTFLPGSIVYLKGENGCGKTSILRTIAGITKTLGGEITFGKNSAPVESFPKPYCAYIGHRTGVRSELTVHQNIHFWAKMHGSAELATAAIVYFKLTEFADIKCGELSAGQKQKVALARLMASAAPIWLLDEAENSLDEEGRLLLNNLIVSKANSGGIIIASSHHEIKIKSAITLELGD